MGSETGRITVWGFFPKENSTCMHVCTQTRYILAEKTHIWKDISSITFTRKDKKKKEAHSFSLWLKKNISAGQGLIVTIHFKILLDCLSPFISSVIQLRVGKVLWPIEWPIHHTYWPLCPGGLGPPNLGCWLHLCVHCLAPQLPRYNPVLWCRLKERNETTMSACPWSEHACTR